MSDNGWWSRHVGGQPAARQAPPQPSPAVHQPPTPNTVPMQHGYPQNAPQHAPAQPAPESFSEALEMSGAWQGEAHQTETSRCPKCGSNHFFSRSQEGVFGQKGRVTPSPQCFDCGYNAIYHQEVIQNA